MYPRRGFGWFPQTGRHEQHWQLGLHPNWNQYCPEQQWEYSRRTQGNYYNFPRNYESGGNYTGSVPYRGSHWRRPQGNVHQKSHHRGRFNKGPKSSFSKESGDFGNSFHSSSLINITAVKKESVSVKAEAPSAAPKETEQDQTKSAALAKQSNSCHVVTGECLTAWQEMVKPKVSKVVTSASDFNFRLPHESSVFPPRKQELPLKKPEEIKVEPGTACPKAEDGHRQAPCVLAVPLTSSVTLENLRPLKEEKDIEMVPINGGQAAEGSSSWTASLSSAEVFSEQRLSQTTEGFHCTVKQEPVQPSTSTRHTDRSKLLVGFLRHQESGKKPRKISKLQIQLKGRRTAKELSHCTTPLASIEAPAQQQTLFKMEKYFHSMEKEEPVQLQAAKDLPHQPASLLTSEAPIEEQRPAEITEGAYSVKKEPSLLEDRQPTHNFCSSVLIDIPFLFDTTGNNQSEKNEETELVLYECLFLTL